MEKDLEQDERRREGDRDGEGDKEKIQAYVSGAQRRAKAIKEVGNQIGDIDDALKGKARKGRKNVKK